MPPARCPGRVDGVVSGYDLPDPDGASLLRSIRVSHPTLPFVLVPDPASASVASEAVEAGASGYVPTTANAGTVRSGLRDTPDRQVPWFTDEHQQRYRHPVEMAPVPINPFDDTGGSIWCNDATLDLPGLDGCDEFVGRSIFEFIHPDDHESGSDAISPAGKSASDSCRRSNSGSGITSATT